ncbi:MAG: sigma-54-dependent transcriptional regulator [Omnitrophica WOR_2 bacterium]
MPAANSILIIDDEAYLRSTLAIILKRAGYSVTTADGAQEALQVLLNNHFDLVFLDLKMPGKDGMELLPEIRLLDPNLPVLILTANASLETAIQSMRMGAIGYLMKPIDPEQIISRVDEIIQEEKLESGSGNHRPNLSGEIQNLLGDS